MKMAVIVIIIRTIMADKENTGDKVYERRRYKSRNPLTSAVTAAGRVTDRGRVDVVVLIMYPCSPSDCT